VFGSVFVHELGHLLAAKAFDLRTVAITLNFFGGVAQFVRQPQTWRAEILIAFAGPAVNLGIAAILLLVTGDLSLEAIRARLLGFRRGIVDDLIFVNLVLGLFNLLPALPFDGGRILRGLLAPFIGIKQGTLVPAYFGVGLGVLLAAYSLFQRDTFTMILGLFLAFSAWIWVQWAQGIANRPGGTSRPL
jgi:Zn-dependent protease